MEHNKKIRQEFRDKTKTMVMGYTHDGIPFSSEYVLWLEDELNKLRMADVIVSCCEPVGEGFYLGTSCPKCKKPFRKNLK